MANQREEGCEGEWSMSVSALSDGAQNVCLQWKQRTDGSVALGNYGGRCYSPAVPAAVILEVFGGAEHLEYCRRSVRADIERMHLFIAGAGQLSDE